MDNRLLVASEYTDPTFYRAEVKTALDYETRFRRKFGLLLITKEIGCCNEIWEHCDELGIPIMVHATITGLGGTDLEPHVPSYKTSIIRLASLVYNSKGRVNRIVLRVDPLIPNVTDYLIVEEILKASSALGIARCRTSVVDYYPFVRNKLRRAGYPTYETFQASREVIAEHLSRMMELCEKYKLGLELCAERFEGAHHRGCACKDDWLDLGLELPLSKSRQRKECFCNVPKYDILKGRDCNHGCLYCYWGRYR